MLSKAKLFVSGLPDLALVPAHVSVSLMLIIFDDVDAAQVQQLARQVLLKTSSMYVLYELLTAVDNPLLTLEYKMPRQFSLCRKYMPGPGIYGDMDYSGRYGYDSRNFTQYSALRIVLNYMGAKAHNRKIIYYLLSSETAKAQELCLMLTAANIEHVQMHQDIKHQPSDIIEMCISPRLLELLDGFEF
jgi:hypothetical protein